MNQKQIPAMQQSTVSPFEAPWCPGLISLLASLNIPSRLLSLPSALPMMITSALCPVLLCGQFSIQVFLISQQHLTLRTIPSFSCPGFLGCWILLVFCLFFFSVSLGLHFLRLFLMALDFYPCWHTDFDPYMMEFSGRAWLSGLFTFVFLPSVSILPSYWWSQVYFPSPDSFPRNTQTYICHQQHHALNATQKLNLQVQNITLDFHAQTCLHPPLPREWSLLGGTCLSSCSGPKAESRFLSLSHPRLAFSKSLFLCFTCSIQHHHSYLIFTWSLAFCTWPLTSFPAHFLSKSLLLQQSKWYWLNIC